MLGYPAYFYMKNRNLKHKDNWATPKYIYDPLNKEFKFSFDPCPLNHDISKWDGLAITWGGGKFCKSSLFKKIKRGLYYESN